MNAARPFKLSFALVLLAPLLLSACSSGGSQPTPSDSNPPASADGKPKPGGTLQDSLLSEPDSMDPATAKLLASSYVIASLFDRLVYLDAHGEPQPWLAESWQIDDGGKKISFKIRSGLKFTDGTPVEAKAVKFTFDRVLAKETASPWKSQLGPLTSVAAPDDSTVEFVFDKPFAPIWAGLASPYMGVVSPAGVEKHGAEFGRNPVGSGPFKLKQWSRGSELLFERNPDYKCVRKDCVTEGPAFLDEWSIKLVTEEGTRMAAMRAGQLDMAWAPFEQVPDIEQDKNLKLVHRDKGYSYIFLEFNESKPPFNNIDVRKAVGYAVKPDEVLIASYIYGDLIQSPMPIGVPGYSKEIGAKHGFKYDAAKVEAHMKNAGYTKTGGKWTKEGAPLTVTLETWNAPQISRAMQVVQTHLQDAGFTVKVQQTDAGTFLAQLTDGKHDFDLMRQTYSDANGLTGLLRSPGRWKHVSDAKLDQLLDAADGALDWQTRKEILDQIQTRILEQAHTVPLFSDGFIIVHRSVVNGYRFDGSGIPVYHGVWLNK